MCRQAMLWGRRIGGTAAQHEEGYLKMDRNIRTSEEQANEITSQPPEHPRDTERGLSSIVRRQRAATIRLLTEQQQQRTHNPRGGLR